MKRTMLVLGSLAALALASGGSAVAQQKKTLAVVVKGLDNPFFTVLGNGCELWNKENPKSEYKCVYTGPASSADEAGVGDEQGALNPQLPGRGSDSIDTPGPEDDARPRVELERHHREVNFITRIRVSTPCSNR